MWDITNPYNIDTSEPLVYFIRVTSPENEYRYIGRSSSPDRTFNAYPRNIDRILAKETKRPPIKRNGEPQSKGNLEYRRIHLVLAVAVERGWNIEHYPICNASKADLGDVEKENIAELNCNVNGKAGWAIEDYDRLATQLT